MIYYYEEMYDEALRCLKGQKEAQSIETTAMAIQTCVALSLQSQSCISSLTPITELC
jgi:hypothetical protein